MTLVAPGASWSPGISTGAREQPIQCLAGYVKIAWGIAGAPPSTDDGFELGPGDPLVLPAGQTWYHVASRGTNPTLFYKGFD